MQFFLANLHAERLSGSADTSAQTRTSEKVDSAPGNAAVTDEARQSSTVPVLSGSR